MNELNIQSQITFLYYKDLAGAVRFYEDVLKFPLLYLLRRVFSLQAFLFLTLVFSCDIKLNNIGGNDNL